MHGLIISDHHPLAQQLCELLGRLRPDLPQPGLVALESAVGAFENENLAPDLVFVALSTIGEAGLTVVRRIASITEAKIVVVGANSDSKTILAAIRAGAADYLDASSNLAEEVKTILQRLSDQCGSRPPGRLITITPASGGTGVSILSTNLASALAAKAGKCALLDFDLRKGDLAALLNIRPKHTVSDLCRNVDRLDAAMFEQSLVQDSTGISLLAAPEYIEDMQHVSPASIDRISALATESFPYVIVDQEDQFHQEQIRLLQLSDVILLLFRLDLTCLQNVLRSLDFMRKVGVEVSHVELVANRCGQPKELSVDQAEDALGRTIPWRIPDDPKTVNSSVNMGVPAVIEWPFSRFSKATNMLADEILTACPA